MVEPSGGEIFLTQKFKTQIIFTSKISQSMVCACTNVMQPVSCNRKWNYNSHAVVFRFLLMNIAVFNYCTAALLQLPPCRAPGTY